MFPDKAMEILLPMFLSTLLFSQGSLGCELSDEYKTTRSQALREARQAFNDCRNSVSQVKFCYKFVQCFERKDGEGVGGGCGHVVGQENRMNYKSLGIDDGFCSILKQTTKEIQEHFDKIVKERNIRKCK